MSDKTSNDTNQRSPAMKTLIAYGRGAAGALLVGLQMVFTMEMWWAGFYVPPYRILLLMLVNSGILFILQHYSGIHHGKTVAGQLRGALVAYGIGIVIAALALYGVNVLRIDTPLREVIGTIALVAIPLSVGASVAMSEFGEEHDEVEERKERAGYWGSLAMGLGGSMIFGFAEASTEEPMVVGAQTHAVHAIAMIIGSLLVVHLIVHAVEFRKRGEQHEQGARWWTLIVRDGVSTYVMAFLLSAYLLWTFGYLDQHTGLIAAVHMTVSLSVLTSIGAAAGELLI